MRTFKSSWLFLFNLKGISLVAKNSSKTLVLSGFTIGYLFSEMVSLLKYGSDYRYLIPCSSLIGA
jgi:ABC-type Fe3+-siderophore transport system permease subunit